MEKRLLIAFILSFGILSVWSMLFPSPKAAKVRGEITQTIDNKEVTESSVLPQPEKIKEEASKVLPPLPAGEKYTIENEKLMVELSSAGARILRITVKGFDVTMPVVDILGDEDTAVVYSADVSKNKAVFHVETDQGIKTKTFVLRPDEYLLESDIKLTSNKEMSSLDKLDINLFTLDINRLDKKIEQSRDKSLLEYSLATPEKTFRKGNAYKFSNKEYRQGVDPVQWAGFRTRYFALVVKPQMASEEYRIVPKDSKELSVLIDSEKKLAENETIEQKMLVFCGPQDLNLMKSYGQGFEDIMKFSNFGLLDLIAKTIYKAMAAMHKIIPSWGTCIILIGLLVYGAMYPLTMKSMTSMKKMQSLQPRINQLREQHKNNPQKLNKEIMDLYKEHQINPLGGCLPLFFQMPVFIGLYQVLWRSVLLKGQSFLWIKDLSEPDRLLTFPTSFPIIGNELNILPIIMMIFMFFQQKLSSKNMVAADPQQAAQQKMMTMFFPFLIGFIFYKFASGLCLYFTVFYIMSTFTQWKISKITKVS